MPVTDPVDGITGGIDAYDWYGTWKLADALIDCRYANHDCDAAFGDTQAQRSLGTWSDGVPVRALEIGPDVA